ncbi:MAG: alpha/beta hydrolase [Nitriliruptoraceae bacterium]|nr:alpha/beta hydrolase [Nitriliruptoraceae bacterium]
MQGTRWPDRGGTLWPRDREVVREDGTTIRYAVAGPPDAPPLVCCAGFLCPDNFWRDIAPALARDHRVILPSYRGVGASSEAGGGALPTNAQDYALEHLIDDVAAVLDAEQVTDATVIGHSMGVQVALGLWRAHPQRTGSLALLAGPYRAPLATFYGSRLGEVVFPVVSSVVPALPRAWTRPLMHAMELQIAMPVAHAIRALGPATPDEGMLAYRHHLGRVDPRTAIWTARGMQRFDAGPWLHEIDVPVLMLVGDRDAWCPVRVGHDLVAQVPDAELGVVPGASHALPIEFPDLVLDRVRALERRARRTRDEDRTATRTEVRAHVPGRRAQ